ncbi:zinc-dependent peptidase [Lacinutrix cladophorae]
MINSFLLQQADSESTPLVFKIVLVILAILVALMVIFTVFRSLFMFFEMAYVEYFKKQQFFANPYFRKKRLAKEYKSILKQEFDFYNQLKPSKQKHFEHRIQYFITQWEFVGKDTEINSTMKVKVAATATKLTLGFRDYKISAVDKIVIYPKTYFSSINQQMHKGEFNMSYKALVFSWEDFEKGYAITSDNLNLGVHECIHAMHITFLKSRRYSTSAAIFLDSFQELTAYIETNKSVKEKLVSSGYFRDYAFENHFEFISVLVENFIETPSEFRSEFPKIYDKVKQMLNFNFAGY